MTALTRGGAEDLVPPERFGPWLADALPGEGGLEIERITSGHSNELFLIRRGADTWILRRPPRIPNAPTAHDMLREHRVLSALTDSAVPHATPRALCADPEVLGAPFYLMDRVAGQALYVEIPAPLAAHRAEIAYAAVDVLARLHNLDWRARGLGDLGRPEGYTERQATRWGKQLASYRFRSLPDLEEVAQWLADTCPGTRGAALLHGDYGLHNLMFAPATPVEVLAVVDWETSTIGDPLTDLGYFLADWIEPDEWADWGALGLPTGPDGFPARAELVDRYAELTGVRPTGEELAWYRTLGQFKIAVILEGSYGRYLRGESDDPFFASLEDRVPRLASHALAISRREA